MAGEHLSDDELLSFVVAADKKLFDEGVEIRQRAWRVPRRLMGEFGYVEYVSSGAGMPLILKRIQAAMSSFYRQQDLANGGHIGVFMYRDIFARIAVPMVFGVVQLNPFHFVELTPAQMNVIQSEPDQMNIYIDQFFDVLDIQFGIMELREPFASMELVVRFLGLSRLHLHSAAAVLTGGYDHRGAIQAALLASELGLKAGIASLGLSEQEIKKKFGHGNAAAAAFVGASWSNFDLERVQRVLAKQPHYVPNRYAAVQPARREVGELVMGAQYLVAEVIRQMSDRNSRGEPPIHARSYPV